MAQAARAYDVVIAGGGTAGCVVAAKIAENGKHPKTGDRLKVAIVEAGPYWKGEPQFGMGAESRRAQITHVTIEDVGRWTWKGWGEATHKLVGGSSVFFGSNAWLPKREDFTAYRNSTDVNWTYEGWHEALKDTQNMFHVHPTPPWAMSKGTMEFKRAAEALGLTAESCPRASKNCLYCGYCGEGYACKYDAKVSSLLAAVPLAEKNGVEIIPDAEIQRVIIEKDANGKPVAKGIEYVRDGKSQQLLAGATIVSCGIIGTPLLLFKSGYGRADVLGDRLVVQNDNIGRHVTGDSSRDLLAVYAEDIKELQLGASGACHFVSVDSHPDGILRLRLKDSYNNRIEFPWENALSEFAPEFGQEHVKFMRDVALTKIGGVKASVQNPVDVEGIVDAEGKVTYEGDPSKIEKRQTEGLEIIHDIIKKTNPLRISEMPDVKFRGMGHKMSSCRAGRDRKDSVVNSDFESHDVQDLLICDNSVYPKHGVSLSCGPAMTIGNYAWRRIVANRFS